MKRNTSKWLRRLWSVPSEVAVSSAFLFMCMVGFVMVVLGRFNDD